MCLIVGNPGLCFELVLQVWCYIVFISYILYYILYRYILLYYYILYYTILLYYYYTIISYTILFSPLLSHLLTYLLLPPLISPSLFPILPPQYSFYTCRYLHILIYILSRYLCSIIYFLFLLQVLTPHKVSEGCLEW